MMKQKTCGLANVMLLVGSTKTILYLNGGNKIFKGVQA